MEDSGFLRNEQKAASVIFAFLQTDCRDSDYSKELLSLGTDLNLARDINCNGHMTDSLLDGDLETDGGIQSNVLLDDIRPQVDLQWFNGPAEAVALREIAERLNDIAAQLERSIVARAAQNLSRNIRASPPEEWNYHLSHEVERVMKQGVGLENLPQERVIVALSLAIVRGVCKQTPQLLRRLFDTTLHFICRAGPR
ncbi:BH3 interacting domain death agonist [Melanotaenia boesemani]|uniref:BH3 interacting domain death agonist n=1 Tax=Melanotaenia boesemani TaxID=1250792 RepID=UPI001C047AAA|nr:BH3 interacting domain death agonist [Melanotaenia boesemani]XP_041853634.1 BH3 interacting domain death agonist [Melanotaenia boesemani]